ncbi:hypothetical protein BKA67DRAFT_541370 [Truncatella angustata]|uniref:Uncharacterized protein n=1 Tax=Truncatella angustata TaxID=152316 RepID=A0A9P8RI14_9PEZI|nr:uncharacterized protein BKA67DRAFT_541370 [Truncatella angustata]KAH6646403.1 hypothetical protein BKA67DRAFT_541370 [Truncatella angustata]KAH8200035.1 hypothetical protein TruAng_005811 [Truncatella angustata]
MSLARAFTTRRAKPALDLNDTNGLQRSNTSTKRHGYTGSIRNKISAPTELTHTTNMLAYNAPDLYPKKSPSTISSKASDDESDGNQTSASSPPTSPDVDSVDDRSVSPEPNHLSCYFTAPGQKLPVVAMNEPPKIPTRALSHTKKASFDNLARQQSLRQSNQSQTSLSSKASFSLSRSSSTSTAATSVSSMSFGRSKATIPEVPELPVIPAESTVTAPLPSRQLSQRKPEPAFTHPFGQELAQVSEIAEEFGVKDKMHAANQEEQDLLRKGLCIFQAEDYLNEVSSVFTKFFAPEPAESQPIWI